MKILDLQDSVHFDIYANFHNAVIKPARKHLNDVHGTTVVLEEAAWLMFINMLLLDYDAFVVLKGNEWKIQKIIFTNDAEYTRFMLEYLDRMT